MISYKGRTFCKAENCKKFYGCPRALTTDVIKRAEQWWGGPDAPISVFAEPEELDCFDPVQEKQEDK